MNTIIKEYLSKKGRNIPADETFSHIDNWIEWYQGDVEKFHRYQVYNGVITTAQKRRSLGMAKKIAEDWANLLLNEKVIIKAGAYEKRLNEILTHNNFKVRSNQLVEQTYAMGTGAFVEYLDADSNVVIDYLRADMIYPLAWDNGEITECAFGTSKVIDGKDTIYLQIHRLGENEGEVPGTYYIENVYVDAESGEEIDPPEDIIGIVDTGSEEPLFQIITPNLCNNIDLDSPFGISIYANSVEQLEGCDIVYDSYINEFILGRKRILVPISAAKVQMQKDGVSAPAFDPSDSIYYQLPGDRESDLKLTEIDLKIRAQEHELGIQRNLDVLSFKTGMGTGRYQFNSSGVKTATEVISDKSDLYQNRQKNAIVIETALINLVKAVSFLDGVAPVIATINFDDSIIEDTNTTIDRNIKLVQAGLRSKKSAIMEIDKSSEKDAGKELGLIAEECQITGQDIDWTKGDNELKEESEESDNESDGEPEGGGGN